MLNALLAFAALFFRTAAVLAAVLLKNLFSMLFKVKDASWFNIGSTTIFRKGTFEGFFKIINQKSTKPIVPLHGAHCMAPIAWRPKKFFAIALKFIGPTLEVRLSVGICLNEGYFLKIFEEPNIKINLLFSDSYPISIFIPAHTSFCLWTT